MASEGRSARGGGGTGAWPYRRSRSWQAETRADASGAGEVYSTRQAPGSRRGEKRKDDPEYRAKKQGLGHGGWPLRGNGAQPLSLESSLCCREDGSEVAGWDTGTLGRGLLWFSG